MEFFPSVRQYVQMCLVLTFLSLSAQCQNISNQDVNFDELCRFEGKCLNCSQGGCDDMCQFYDNICCNKTSPRNILLEKWQYSCARTFPDMYDLNLDCRGSSKGVFGVYMVTKSSKLWTDGTIKTKCESSWEKDILSRIPVYDSTVETVTYKNVYCAFCNRLSIERLKFWKFDLMCNNGAKVNQSVDNQEYDPLVCFIRLMNRQHKMCAIDVIESCREDNDINSSLRDRCENGLSQNVYAWKYVNVFNVYKNEFCARCNYETGTLQCWAFQAFTCWPQDLPPYTDVKAMNSLRLYGNGDTHSMEIFNYDMCGDGVLYDPFGKLCLNVTCLPLMNTCISGECHLVELAHSDYLIQNDSSLFLADLGEIIREGRYFIGDSNAHACLDDNQYMEFEIYVRQQSTLTVTLQRQEQSTPTVQEQIITSDSCIRQIQLFLLAIPFAVTFG